MTADDWYRRGLASYNRRLFEQARRELSRAAALDPSDARCRSARAEVAFDQLDFRAALEDLDWLARRGSADAAALSRRGAALALLGRTRQALAQADALAADAGAAAWGHWLRGYCALLSRRPSAAQDDFVAAWRATAARGGGDAGKIGLYYALARALPELRREPRPGGAELVLCGLGLRPPQQATLESVAAARSCDLVFCNVAGGRVTELMALLCRDVRPIDFRGDPGDVRRCADIVARELRPGRRVGFVTSGHALIFGPLAEELLGRCRAVGARMRSTASVSSIDHFALSAQERLGRAFDGYQVYEHVELRDRPRIDAGVPAIVFFNLPLVAGDPRAVAAGLRAAYGSRGRALVFGPGKGDGAARAIPLGRLAEARDVFAGSTQELFVPPPLAARRPPKSRDGGRLLACGLGPRPERHATLEALGELSSCEIVFCDADAGFASFLARFCRDVRPLPLARSPSASARRALAACRPGRTVAVAGAAHPVQLGPFADALLAGGARRGVEVRVVPGVSALAEALSSRNLLLGASFHGFQDYGWREVLTRGFTASPRLPAVVAFDAGCSRARYPAVFAGLAAVYGAGRPARWLEDEGAEAAALEAWRGRPPRRGHLLILPSRPPAGAAGKEL